MVRLRPPPDRRHPLRAPGGVRSDAGLPTRRPRCWPRCWRGCSPKAPEMVDRCDDFSADCGLDNAPQKKQLWDKWTIRPPIDTRLMWKAEKEEPGYDPERPITRPLFPERADVIVHDERGRVSCICPETGELRAMAFQGFEAERGACGTVECRCPAAAFGFECVGSEACHRAGGVTPGEYGRIVRIDLDKPRPAHLHADAVGQSVLAARLQPPFGDGEDQQPPRQRLQLRDPLHPRARQDEDPCRAGAGGDDGAGPRAGAGWPRRADALTASAPCRTPTPADRLSAFRHRRSTGPPAGTGQAAAARPLMFR